VLVQVPLQLRRAALVHGWAILVLPVLGMIGTGLWTSQHGVGAGEIAWLIGMHVFTMAGISIGYHRLWTHRAFTAGPVLRVLLAIAGCMACQGPPLYWIANHRLHHAHSDRPGDPHSPWIDQRGRGHRGLRGWVHAHVGWMLGQHFPDPLRMAPDCVRDPVIGWAGRNYLYLALAGIAMPGIALAATRGSWHGLVSGLLWGGAVRLLLSLHATSAINSLCHQIGLRRDGTGDHSRNLPGLALLTLGESWHANHHRHPRSASFSARWWQLDPGWWAIRLCTLLGLAHKPYLPARRRNRT
jgi:stearoyl-CoA desaturase (Delta-9 desaturase)